MNEILTDQNDISEKPRKRLDAVSEAQKVWANVALDAHIYTHAYSRDMQKTSYTSCTSCTERLS